MRLEFGKGYNFDLPAWELAPGVWSGGSNFRPRGGIEELWDGAGLHSNTWPTALYGYPVSVAGTQKIVYFSSTKAYTRTTGGDESEITRYTDGQIVSNATAAGTTVTITTAAAHGLSTSDVITAFGFTPSTYNATAVAITVTGATTFTYTVASAPATSPATYMGGYQGNAIVNHNALSGTQRYTGGSFNGLALFNHPADGLYYYSGTGQMKKVPGFHATGGTAWNTAAAVRTFKGFIIAMNVTESGTNYRQRVKWSDAVTDVLSLPTAWNSTTTNKAGQVDLSGTDGPVVDGLPMGEAFIIYLKDGRYAAQYVESNEVFVFNKLPGTAGLLTQNCVVDTPVGHVFMTPDFDVMVHQGGEPKSVAEGKFKRFLARTINGNYAHLCFLTHDPRYSEVLICIPSTATAVCDKAIAWNYVDNTIGYFDLTSGATSTSGVAFATNGLWPSATSWHKDVESVGFFCFHSSDSTKSGLYGNLVSNSGRWFGTQITGTLTREGMDLGDRDLMKTIHRSRWALDQDGASGGDTVSIYHGSSMTADKAATFTSPVTYTISTTDYANARATQGRYLAIKLITSSLTVLVQVRSVDLDIAPGGKR